MKAERNARRRSRSEADAETGFLAVNSAINPILIQPIAILGFEPPIVGAPIMREGFITETGFLLGSPQE
jgi:hypothetical protein